ncbi:MAG: DUF1571 domain-containing protein [bacterium]|nr:DUF1571 domain-containing protein [bacterium]
MYDSIKNIRTLRQNVHAIERIEKTYSNSVSEIKLQTRPEKVYFRGLSKDVEILYDSEKPEVKALIKLHTFPYLMLNLDPRGNLMRKNQHYTIHELGYGFIGKSVALTINKDRDGIKNFTYRGKAVKNGYTCHLLEYENTNYTYVNYTVRDKETASVIAYELCVNDYLLRYKNNLLNDFGYLKKGTVLKVPTLYCKKAMVFLEEKMMLPVSLSLYDDMGLFESYDYTHIQINKPFQADEFDRDNDAYDF